MSPFVKQLVNELGRTEEEIVKAWDESKKETADAFGIDESEFTKREIEYTKELVRESLGEQRQISVLDFLNSDKSADDFIEEAVQTSDSLGIDKSVVKKDDEEDDEDEDEDEDEENDDIEEASKETAKCPTCGGKYLVATGYCLTCKKKVKKEKETSKGDKDETDK